MDTRAGKGRGLFEDLMARLRRRREESPHAPLAAIRDLANEFGVAKATLQKAIDALRAEGLLTSVRGKGTFWVAEGGASEPARSNSMVTLAASLRDRILDGAYRVGQALPKVGFIANQERVSPDTVCAALKALETEGLIRKQGKSWLAGKAGLEPKPDAASSPLLRKPSAILLIVPDYRFWDNAYHDDHSGKFVQNFYLEIERMGLETHLATLEAAAGTGLFSAGRSRIQTLIESLGDRYLGAMYLSPDVDMSMLSWLARYKKPVVWLDLECPARDLDMRSLPGGPRLFRCLKNEGVAVTLALDTLHRLGHRRIGFPTLRANAFPWMVHRLDLVRERAAQYDPPLTLEEVEHGEDFWSPKPWMGPEEFRVWLNRVKPAGGRRNLRALVPSLVDLVERRCVTAILAPNDYFAHQYFLWLMELGLSVPGDVALLSFDNNHYSRPFSISSIDFGFSDLAYQVSHIFLGDIPVKADARNNLFSRPVLLGRHTLAGPRAAARARTAAA